MISEEFRIVNGASPQSRGTELQIDVRRGSRMFGRVRPATCSVDSLERTPSKIVKDHSLYVFENTLMKLKLGSKRQLRTVCDQSKADADEKIVYAHSPQFTCSAAEELVLAHEDSVPEAAIKDSCKPMSSSNNNLSVVYMFSKYRISQKHLIPPCDQKDDKCPL